MNVIDWILQGDVFVHYLVNRDLLRVSDKKELNNLRKRILTEGFGKELLSRQDLKTYMWGGGVYSPKYTSTHYTLLELCEFGAPLDEERFIEAIKLLFKVMWKNKGQVRPYRHQDMCVVAMMVRIACTAGFKDPRMEEMIDYILEYPMSDGGWNCAWERKLAPKQSSLHTTLSVLEAFNEYKKSGYTYRLKDIEEQIPRGVEYILTKRLFRSVRTNEIIHKEMITLYFPYGWRYDILRALTVMKELDIPYDERMEDALDLISSRLDEYGRIKADKKPTSIQHFRITKTNKLCPYNTYRVLNVLKYYRLSDYESYRSKEIE